MPKIIKNFWLHNKSEIFASKKCKNLNPLADFFVLGKAELFKSE